MTPSMSGEQERSLPFSLSSPPHDELLENLMIVPLVLAPYFCLEEALRD